MYRPSVHRNSCPVEASLVPWLLSIGVPACQPQGQTHWRLVLVATDGDGRLTSSYQSIPYLPYSFLSIRVPARPRSCRVWWRENALWNVLSVCLQPSNSTVHLCPFLPIHSHSYFSARSWQWRYRSRCGLLTYIPCMRNLTRWQAAYRHPSAAILANSCHSDPPQYYKLWSWTSQPLGCRKDYPPTVRFVDGIWPTPFRRIPSWCRQHGSRKARRYASNPWRLCVRNVRSAIWTYRRLTCPHRFVLDGLHTHQAPMPALSHHWKTVSPLCRRIAKGLGLEWQSKDAPCYPPLALPPFSRVLIRHQSRGHSHHPSSASLHVLTCPPICLHFSVLPDWSHSMAALDHPQHESSRHGIVVHRTSGWLPTFRYRTTPYGLATYSSRSCSPYPSGRSSLFWISDIGIRRSGLIRYVWPTK